MADSSAFLSSRSRRKGLDALAEDLIEVLEDVGAHLGAVYLLAPDAQVLELAVMKGAPREFIRPWERMSLATPVPITDAIQQQRLVWVGDEKEMASIYPGAALVMPYEFALAALPLVGADTVYGAMFALWAGTHSPWLSSTERDRLAAAAAQMAKGLEEADREGRRLRPGLAPRVVTAPSMQPVEAIEAVAARLPEGVCGMDVAGRITFATPRAAELLGVLSARLVGSCPWTSFAWLNDPVYEDRYRAAMISQQPTSFVALRPPDRWLSFDLYPAPTGITIRITPAMVEAEDAEPDPASVADLPSPAPEADPALPTRVGALYHILHLASTLTKAASVQDVVDLVADRLMPAFGGDGMALLVADDDRMRVVGARGYPPHVKEQYEGLPMSSPTPSVRTMVTGVPSFFGSQEELDQVYPSAVAQDDGMAAWAFLPLIASGRSVGTCVLAFARPHRFTVEERALLTSLGGLIAQALERARLYDAKLELAHALQESLLPHALPRLPGLTAAARYLPGTEGMDIGGDFYDVIRLDEDTVAAVVGDVQGHNVTAAALMGQVRTAVRAYATAGADPGEVLSRTNHLLVDLDPGLFASCVYLRLDLRSNQACLARAGHPQPLLRLPNGDVQVVGVPGGLLLGIDHSVDYPHTEIALPPGAVLALYTDGLVETPGVDIDDALDDLGAELARTGDRPLEEVADRLIRHAQQTSHRSDDIALLLLRLAGGDDGPEAPEPATPRAPRKRHD
ncbi:GAF domain-containing SpoIIE family protein phosphatase [Streptosporangium sp. NPDC051022]|uniref:GAF domain-containing SpoIIE family protein phosphatase n=1 Tax=Streptosporangium sp. NPDC051022 TaxID=3155752 RepID=UPI003418DDBA